MRILFIPFYSEQHIGRKKELDYVLAANITNSAIDKIVLVADETISEHTDLHINKVEIYRLGKRATYHDFFYTVVPKYVDEDDLIIIANSDIMFDDTIKLLDNIDWSKDIALACSRWDKTDEGYQVYPTWDSQDFWCFKGEIKGMYADFMLGSPGCDNRIMHEIDKAGYMVFNPSKDIHGFHVHESGVRSYTRQDTVPPPYKLMHPHGLDQVKTIQPKKIRHIGMYGFIAERAIGDGLSVNGDYQFLDWLKYTHAPAEFKILDRDKFERDILQFVNGADVVFMQLQTPDIITSDLMKRIKETCPRAACFNWTGDVRVDIPRDILDIAPYCTTLFTNDTDVKDMRSRGFKSQYLQIGFPHDTFNPKGSVNKTVEPIVFMGQNYYNDKEHKHNFPNGKFRQDMVMFLKEKYGDKFGVYGGGWSGLESGNLTDDHIKEASAYRGTKIAINVSHFDYELYSSDRILRIMGCGALCMCKRYPRVEEEYADGVNLVLWDTLDDLKDKIEYYRTHPDEAKKIAEAGCKLVHSRDRWDKRLKQLIKSIK